MAAVLDRDDRDTTTADPVIRLALKRFKLGSEARRKQLERENADLAFQVPEKQWPDEQLKQRGPQTVGNVAIPGRPVLSISKIDQPIQLVANQEKSAHLGVQVHPLSEDATDDTAEVQQGLYRRIEVDSRANLARSWAFDRAIKAGWGCYRVLKEYADDGGDPFDQCLVIKRILNQGSVVFDPFAVEPDWSDGRWAFVPELMPFDRYKETFPDSKLATYGADDFTALLQDNDLPGWVTGEGEGRAVLVAEYWRVEYTQETIKGPKGKTRVKDVPKVTFVKMNAVEVLEEEEWDGKYIPIIPVIGKELQPFDGERRWVGIIGPAKDGQRLFNYAASTAVEIAALEPKAPFVGAAGQFRGHETQWQQVNVRNFPYVEYEMVALNGEQAPPPQRMQIDAARLGPSMMLLQQAESFIQSTTFTFDPSLGKQNNRDRSGKAVLAQQQQGDASNSNYLDNLAEISMTYEAKVVLDLIPKVYDRPGRIARILGTDDKASTVMLNAPYTQGADGRPMPAPQGPPPLQRGPQGMPPQGQAGQPQVKHHDLSKGIYGSSVSIGKSYQTRMQQGADALGQVLQTDPALMALLGDIWFRFQDFPGHTEAAERLKKMLPPPLQEGKDGQDDPRLLKQQRDQAAQMVEQIGKELQAKNEYIQTEKAKYEVQLQITALQIDSKERMAAADREKDLAVAELGAKVDRLALFMEERQRIGAQQLDHAADGMSQAADHQHEHQQGELDRQHEIQMAQVGQAHAMEQGDQAGVQSMMQGDQAHGQALEQQAQAAALEPAPEAGE